MDRTEDICYDCFNLDLEQSPFAVVTTINNVQRREVTITVPFGTHEPHTPKCGYCAMMRAAIKPCVPEYTGRQNAYLHLASFTMIRNEPLLLTLEDWGVSKDEDGSRFGVEVFRPRGVVIPGLEWLGEEDVCGSKQDRGRDWWKGFVEQHVEDCDENHRECGSPLGKLPTRVLDLGLQTDDLEAELRLVCMSSGETGRYAALSHCWGPGGIEFKLEESTFEQLNNSIKVVNLPATHQDAVYISRKLGIRYLWIDSLCIIQDNEADVQRETAIMSEIYANAYLTIAAVSSANSKIHFLNTQLTDQRIHKVDFQGARIRNPLRSVFDKMSRSSRHAKMTLCARLTQRTSGRRDNSASGTTAAGISDSVIGPLSRRAWTLQERALASRVVHFTSEGVRFECPTHFKTESGQISMPGYLGRWQHLEALVARSNENSAWARDELQKFWRRMLSDYTQRGITRRTDILPALSGLAARMQKIHGAEYVAGLWRDRLVQDLCWSVQNVNKLYRESSPVHREESALPSWSWISVPCPAIYPLIDEQGVFTSTCEVLDCQTQLAGSGLNPFGQVTSGQLLIRGLVRKAELRGLGGSLYVEFGQGNETKLEADVTLTCSVEGGVEDTSSEKCWRRAIEGDDVEMGIAEVLCLKLGVWKPNYSTTNLSAVEHGFVVVLGKSSQVDGAYERLGLLEKSYGLNKFEDVEGTFGLMKKVDQLYARISTLAGSTGDETAYSRPGMDGSWLEKMKQKPAYPAAQTMNVRIV